MGTGDKPLAEHHMASEKFPCEDLTWSKQDPIKNITLAFRRRFKDERTERKSHFLYKPKALGKAAGFKNPVYLDFREIETGTMPEIYGTLTDFRALCGADSLLDDDFKLEYQGVQVYPNGQTGHVWKAEHKGREITIRQHLLCDYPELYEPLEPLSDPSKSSI